MKEKISVGILLNDVRVRQWIFCSIDNLVRSDNTEVTLLISNPPASGAARGKQHLLSMFIIRLFEFIDYLIFYRRHNYNRKRDITEINGLNDIVDLRQSVMTTDSENDDFVQVVARMQPDVIVKFGEHCLDSQILKIPQHGIWSFSVDRKDIPGGLDHGFWEVVRYNTVSYSAVEQAKDNPALDGTIYGSWESTCPFSVNKNRNKLFSRAVLFLPRLINGLRIHGDEYLAKQRERAVKNDLADPGSGIQLDFPAVIRDVSRCLLRISGLVMNKLLYTDAFSWQLMFDIRDDAGRLSHDYSLFRKIKPPAGCFWADPFVVAGDGNYYVFVEEFIYRKNKAHIAVLELDGNGTVVSHRPVIGKPYHMSYPFIFKYGGSYYMIPETAGNRTIELYRCIDFPDKWQFEKYIMKNVSATDTTLFRHNDKWWLFTTLDQTGSVSGGSTELFLFYSDDPLSDKWISHPLNPVVSDETSARCAGNLFLQDGEIYRPSQDCSMRYGRGLNINRVTLLDEKEYNEVLVEEIKPYWDKKLKGVHTLNFDKNFTIIDTYKFHRRFSR